jgi:hypothetical protein
VTLMQAKNIPGIQVYGMECSSVLTGFAVYSLTHYIRLKTIQQPIMCSIGFLAVYLY